VSDDPFDSTPFPPRTVIRLMVAALLASALGLILLSCSCKTTSAKGSWSGPEPITSLMRQQVLDIWQAELADRSPDAPMPTPISNFSRLRVRVFLGEPLPDGLQWGNMGGFVYAKPGSWAMDVYIRNPHPQWDKEPRHEAFHVYLIPHGESGHPPMFGKRHEIWRWGP